VDAQINDLASDGTSLYASGRFSEIETLATPNIARWDGAAWNAMGTNPPWDARLAIHGGVVYAASDLDVSYFDGGAWQSISTSQEGGRIVSYGTELITSNGPNPLSSWDGSSWTALTGAGAGTLNDVAEDFTVFEGDLIVVGRFTEVDGVPARVAVWDGTTLSAWTPSALPDPPGALTSVASFDGRVILTGYGGAGLWSSSAQGFPWEVLAGGLDGIGPTLQAFDGDLYVGGEFGVVGDQTGETGVVSSHIACLRASPTAVDDGTPPMAAPVSYPNPFNPATTIRYSVPQGGAEVRIVIHDVAGRRVRTLLNARVGGGVRTIEWDGRDDAGGEVASGAYFYRIGVGEQSFTGKMTLLK
jgi:hypothetical protein